MIALKAANGNDQKKLDEAVKRFEKLFLLLESEQDGERSSAATQLRSSLEKINQLLGKTPGQSGYFGLRDILQGADTSDVAQNLDRAKELIREYEVNNKNLALSEACFRDEVERLQAEIERVRNMQNSGTAAQVAGRIGPVKDFVMGATGISFLLAIVAGGLLDFFPWVNIFLVSAGAILIVPLGLRHIGGFCLKVSDEAQYRIAHCASGAMAGLKALAFSFVLLFTSGIAAQTLGVGSFLGIALPAELSGEGIADWIMAATPGIFGMLFLAAGVGLFFFIRWRARNSSLPGVLDSLFS